RCDPRSGTRCVRARPQRRERRMPRGTAKRCDGNVERRASPWVRARPRRGVGVRQGRRSGEVLHAGTAMTSELLTNPRRRAHAPIDRCCAPNYDPLPVTLTRGRGAWVEDDGGCRYLDFLSAYSALNFGHCHPRLVATARRQLARLTVTSRAFGTDNLEPFC